MRTNVARCVLMTLTAAVLSGCYSDGHWTMPWNQSFQSSNQTAPVATPGEPLVRRQNRRGWRRYYRYYDDAILGLQLPRHRYNCAACDFHGYGQQLQLTWRRLPTLFHAVERPASAHRRVTGRPARPARASPVMGPRPQVTAARVALRARPAQHLPRRTAQRIPLQVRRLRTEQAQAHLPMAAVRAHLRIAADRGSSVWSGSGAHRMAAVQVHLPTAAARAQLLTAAVRVQLRIAAVRAAFVWRRFKCTSLRQQLSAPSYGSGSSAPPYGSSSNATPYGSS